MTQKEFNKILSKIIRDANSLVKKAVPNETALIDYVTISSKSEDEYEDLLRITGKIGKIIYQSETGSLYKLNRSRKTSRGILRLIKIRKFDSRKGERGYADFRVENYAELKADILAQKLVARRIIKREFYEMIELSNERRDVLTHIPNKPLSIELEINSEKKRKAASRA